MQAGEGLAALLVADIELFVNPFFEKGLVESFHLFRWSGDGKAGSVCGWRRSEQERRRSLGCGGKPGRCRSLSRSIRYPEAANR